VQRTFVLLLTTLAFVAALFVVPPPAAAAKKGEAAIGAARLAMVHVAKPIIRKAERSSAPALTPHVFSVHGALLFFHVLTTAPTTWTPPALDRSVLMVFLN
jgi:hypothetical protein